MTRPAIYGSLTTRPHRRRGRAVISAAAVVLGAAGALAGFSGSSAARASARDEAPIGILSAEGTEQAPVLAQMHVTRARIIDGYRFYVGTIGGHPVVDAFGGEVDESAELATYLLISHFHPRAMLFSGTAGAQAAPINVGDVVLSGYVMDKSNVHYERGGYQIPYEGVEVRAAGADLRGAITDGYDNPAPTPGDAKSYKYGPDKTNRGWVYVSAFAGDRQLVTLGRHTPSLGRTPLAVATGKKATGSVANKLVVGVIGQAQVWTEPLRWLEDQDFLYQTDAEENEGSGFAFACATQGVPFMLIRGISDTPWHPAAYDGIIASDHAAKVVGYVVRHLPAKVSKAPVTFSELSPETNARKAGYLIAKKDYFSVGPVTEVTYREGGKLVTLRGARLRKLEEEYSPSASTLEAAG